VKNNQLWEGIMDQFPWLILITGVLIVATNVMVSIPIRFLNVTKYIIIIGVFMVIFTQGRAHKNILLRIASGVGSLYGLIGYLSDVLSYSRLFALGLATGVIAVVVNNLVMMVEDNSILGIILAIIVYIVGHIFNLVISGLSAFVHTTRLQYVEFFTKFYEGGGKAFKPFKMNTDYIVIKKIMH